jgi:hypothetical protein
MEPELMSDALDDLRDFYATQAPQPPRVFDVPRDFIPTMIAARETLAADAEFLQIVDPVAFLIRGTVEARAQYYGMHYAATQEQARGVRHNAYSEGAVKPSHRMTRAEKIAADDRKWGLRS